MAVMPSDDREAVSGERLEARPSPGPGSVLAAFIATLGVAIVVTHVIASRAFRGWLWGADAYAFLPPASLFIIPAGLAVILVVAWRRSRALLSVEPLRPVPNKLAPILALVSAAVLFWMLRVRHVLLGDGIPITNLLPESPALHPREPLSSLLHHALYDMLGPLFAGAARARADVVQDAVAIGSVLAGVAFVAVAWQLARELVLAFPTSGQPNERRFVPLLTLAILAQGYMLLFFGYVETYAYPAVGAGLFLLAGMRYLRGASGLWLPLAIFALDLSLHFALIVLGPALLVLAIVGVLDPQRRANALRDLALAAGATLAIVLMLARGPAHYDFRAQLAAMLGSARATTAYLFSAPHLRDFLNEHVLIGPFGLLLAVPAAVLAITKRGRGGAVRAFLAVAALTVAVACWTVPDLPLGYARDWDLFGPLGVVATVTGLGLSLAVIVSARMRQWAIAVVLAVSLFHTVPWIVLNMSDVRSAERFATLPLGSGRTEITIAYWHAKRGDRAQAKQWVRRALEVDPVNTRAMDLRGRLAFDEGDHTLALRVYLITVALRPDKLEYVGQLARATHAVPDPALGISILDTLQAGREDHAVLWLERAMLLRAGGRSAEADAARARGLQLDPKLAPFEDALRRAWEAPPSR